MNFYELFEKKDDNGHSQDVDIADPKAALALKQARAKYTYAKSDLEAFVKMVQDEEEEDQKEFDKLEKETERQESDIKDLEHKEQSYSANIEKLEKENDLLQKQITTLKKREADYEKVVNNLSKVAPTYSKKIDALQKELDDLEFGLRGVKGFRATPRTKPGRNSLPEPETLPPAEILPGTDFL